MYKNMKLNEWMELMLVTPVKGIEKYYVDQPLTNDQADEIMHMIEEAAECDLTSLKARKNQLRRGDPYRTFLECYVNLIFAGYTKAWRSNLWNALADVDKIFMKSYTKQLFNVDIEVLM